jgi:hypothetical protein
MGECPVCHLWKRILPTGNVATHSDRKVKTTARFPPLCTGGGQRPITRNGAN